MAKDFIILAYRQNDILRWAFSVSKTGQLDFGGEIKEDIKLEGYSELDASTYFSPARYEWLPKNLCAQIRVAIPNDQPPVSSDVFAFLTHIGAVLLAVHENDTLLAAELFNARSEQFMRFAPLVLYILKDIAPLALFAWVYGRKGDESEFRDAYYSEQMFNPNNCDTGVVLYEASKEKLNPNPQNESPEDMFVRYFKSFKGSFCIGSVGAAFHPWAKYGLGFLEARANAQNSQDIFESAKQLARAKDEIFQNINVSVQTEPHNAHDANAIAILIDDIEQLLGGLACKKHAGYLRSSGAAILRKAFNKKLSFKASLARLGNAWDGKAGIVVRIEL